jgi:rSAM/selenodomain-associated transferase 1
MVGQPPPAVAAVLTRAPSSGGKSRLFAALGRPFDPALVAAMLLDTLEGAHVDGVRQAVAVDPPEARDEIIALLPEGVSVLAQVPGTLGDRMRGTMQALFAEGAAIVVLLGSDLPDITGEPVARAVAILSNDPGSVVIGPAADGGYYLLAATAVPPIFDGIDWGGPAVLDQTRAAAVRAGLRIHLLEAMNDVDTPADLRRSSGPRTKGWVDRALAPPVGPPRAPPRA